MSFEKLKIYSLEMIDMLTSEELAGEIQKNPLTKEDVEYIVKHNIYRISGVRLRAKGILVPVRGYRELFDMCLSSIYGPNEAKITALHEVYTSSTKHM